MTVHIDIDKGRYGPNHGLFWQVQNVMSVASKLSKWFVRYTITVLFAITQPFRIWNFTWRETGCTMTMTLPFRHTAMPKKIVSTGRVCYQWGWHFLVSPCSLACLPSTAVHCPPNPLERPPLHCPLSTPGGEAASPSSTLIVSVRPKIN